VAESVAVQKILFGVLKYGRHGGDPDVQVRLERRFCHDEMADHEKRIHPAAEQCLWKSDGQQIVPILWGFAASGFPSRGEVFLRSLI
jgi:hypothetical protein